MMFLYQSNMDAAACLSSLALSPGILDTSAADGRDYDYNDYDQLIRCHCEDRERLGDTLESAWVMNSDREIRHNAKLVANIHTLYRSAKRCCLSWKPALVAQFCYLSTLSTI